MQDVETGWQGLCLGLNLVNHTIEKHECRLICCATPSCEVWQWGNMPENVTRKIGSCFIGHGMECQSERFDEFQVLAGQRIAHGSVGDATDLEKGRWCTGDGMKELPWIPGKSWTGNWRSQAKYCQQACFLDPGCSVWQHSSELGCWTGFSDTCQQLVPTMVDGQRVARSCAGPGIFKEIKVNYLQATLIMSTVLAIFMTFACAITVIRTLELQSAIKHRMEPLLDFFGAGDEDSDEDSDASESGRPRRRSSRQSSRSRSHPAAPLSSSQRSMGPMLMAYPPGASYTPIASQMTSQMMIHPNMHHQM